jgi:iron-sulfur cluster repair protein YtfE (RIC family)
MLTRLGAPAAQGDVVDALLDCHTRIRDFLALAGRVAGAAGAPADEVRDAAARVHRYFTVALPLHAEDEERSVLPRLSGLDPEVDRELAAMHREHAEHDEPLSRLLAACAALVERPAALPEVAGALLAAQRDLARHFEAHLAREERTIFPALRVRLPPGEQAAILAEIRARRAG